LIWEILVNYGKIMENRTKTYFLLSIIILALSIIILAISLFFICNCTLKSFKPGLTYEEYLRVNPPPPRNLSGTLTADYIELRWDIPETVKVPHDYSDIIAYYKIYRGTSEEDMSYLASTSDLTFKDFNISGSPQYVYEVTAVHEGETESVPSQEIIVQTSGAKPPSGGKV